MIETSTEKTSKQSDFAQKSRLLRAALNLTQLELAERMKFGRSAVVAVERGTPPSRRFKEQIAILEKLAGIAPFNLSDQSERTNERDPLLGEETSFGSNARATLRAARLAKGWTENDLAQRARVPAAHIRDVERGNQQGMSEKNLRKIAKILGLSVEALMGGSDSPQLLGEGRTFGADPQVKTFGFEANTIPLLSMAQAGEMTDHADIYDYEGVIDYVKKKGAKTYAVRIVGDSMLPLYPQGTIAVVEPDREFQNEKLAIVKLKDERGVLFKTVQLRGEKYHLISMNERFAPIVTPRNGVQWVHRVVRTLHEHE